jgi:hypothetical protein
LDKTIVTAFLVIAGVFSAVFVFNSIYPAMVEGSAAINSMQNRLDERIKSQVEIVYATKSGATVLVWAKNIGSLRVASPEASDLFFGPEGNFVRIPYGIGTPHWEYTIENDTDWNPTATMRITIVGFTPLDSGRYFAKVVLPNGIADESVFSW